MSEEVPTLPSPIKTSLAGAVSVRVVGDRPIRLSLQKKKHKKDTGIPYFITTCKKDALILTLPPHSICMQCLAHVIERTELLVYYSHQSNAGPHSNRSMRNDITSQPDSDHSSLYWSQKSSNMGNKSISLECTRMRGFISFILIFIFLSP